MIYTLWSPDWAVPEMMPEVYNQMIIRIRMAIPHTMSAAPSAILRAAVSTHFLLLITQ